MFSIQRRPLSSDSLDTSLPAILDRIYRGRKITNVDELETTANGLCHYNQLHGIDHAVEVLANAMRADELVMIVGDFDADGATSTALSLLALSQMGMKHLDYLVPNRFDFGYGLSPGIVELAHEKGAKVIMTVDNGIACFDGVNRAKALGIKVIITDHHLPADTLPDADAIVNPNQPDCSFPSKNLAGVGVAFYIMLACRAHLQTLGWFEQQRIAPPNLASLLDIVAIGTVADVVPLDKNNRILVHQGLQRIRSGKCRPGILALLEVANREGHRLTSTDLGFVIGPRLNAAGRLEDMSMGIECLITDSPNVAREIATELDSLIHQRKAIEADMKAQAQQIVENLVFENTHTPSGLVVYREDFHQGVIGIVAGRIKEQYHRPTIAFAKDDNGDLKGSARSIEGIHIRDVLEEINTQHPGVIKKFGGHAMAAGLTLSEVNLTRFQQAFEHIAKTHLARLGEHSVIYTDGELCRDELSLSTAKLLRTAGPFGQGFEPPQFDGDFTIVTQRIVGQNHLKLVLRSSDNEEIDGIMFNIDLAQWPDNSVKTIRAVYQLDVNVFRGQESVQLLVSHIEKNEKR